jgi:GT2 family glycosyltransferase
MLSVVILSKTASNLFPCVEAVRKHEPDARVIVVDDGCESIPEGVEVVPGEKSFVFARNANIGIRAAGESDVVLLNDDALLQTTGGLSIMQQAAIDQPQYGLVGSTCNNVGNRAQWPQGFGLRLEPRMVCFVCAFIPRKTIDRVGLLEERFVHYGFEDDDYCLRVRRAGLLIGIHDGCYCDHGSLKSSFRGSATAPGMLAGNAKIFKDKWGGWNHEL